MAGYHPTGNDVLQSYTMTRCVASVRGYFSIQSQYMLQTFWFHRHLPHEIAFKFSFVGIKKIKIKALKRFKSKTSESSVVQASE